MYRPELGTRLVLYSAHIVIVQRKLGTLMMFQHEMSKNARVSHYQVSVFLIHKIHSKWTWVKRNFHFE